MRVHPANAPTSVVEAGLVPVVVSVDDTDDETRATSTGQIASLIASAAVALGGSLRLGVTRHQLLLRDDVPYTSHNSAMAFEVLMPAAAVDELRMRAAELIAAHRAPTSDPGLCIVSAPGGKTARDAAFSTISVLSEADEWALEQLAAFGRRAKIEYCSIESAYKFARRIPWIYLGSHGGNGSGVVGALAGAGLRLGGDDGRFRGKWDFSKLCMGEEMPDVGIVSRHLSHDFRGPVSLVDSQGAHLPLRLPFSPVTEAKPILFNGALTVVCEVVDGGARPLSKVDLGDIGNVEGSWLCACDAFERDNDEDECFDAGVSCKNCLHRRWVAGGFKCVRHRLGHVG